MSALVTQARSRRSLGRQRSRRKRRIRRRRRGGEEEEDTQEGEDEEGKSGGEETMARGTKGDRAENQYEITLARASAKLQVIKRADKQMKQREARGAASPRRE